MSREMLDNLLAGKLRDPDSGGSIPANYNPESGTRVGEEQDTRAGREGAGGR